MAEARNDQEPSIEEILASIREIISDDDAPKKEGEAAPASEPSAAPSAAPADKDDDVLDLAAFAEEQKPLKVQEEQKSDPLAGIDLEKPKVMTVAFTDEEKPAPKPEPRPEPAMASPVGPEEALMTEPARDASVDSLTRLAQNIAIARAGDGSQTLEDMVREMLRPMLREWLDRNLPPMIQRMVERELERLTKQAMDR